MASLSIPYATRISHRISIMRSAFSLSLALAGALLSPTAAVANARTARSGISYARQHTDPGFVIATHHGRAHFFYPFSLPKPPPPEVLPQPPAEPATPPTVSLAPPVVGLTHPTGPVDRAVCAGYARFPRSTELLRFARWSVQPLATSRYAERFQSVSCRRGLQISRLLRGAGIHVGNWFRLRNWGCKLRVQETGHYGKVVELTLTCRSARYEFIAVPVNIIVLETEEASNYPPPGAIYLAGDSVELVPYSGPGWAWQPKLDAAYAALEAYYLVGRHRCGIAAAVTEYEMAREKGLVLAGQGIYPPSLDYPVAALKPGTYWACLYLQRTADQERAGALMEAFAVVK